MVLAEAIPLRVDRGCRDGFYLGSPCLKWLCIGV